MKTAPGCKKCEMHLEEVLHQFGANSRNPCKNAVGESRVSARMAICEQTKVHPSLFWVHPKVVVLVQ